MRRLPLTLIFLLTASAACAETSQLEKALNDLQSKSEQMQQSSPVEVRPPSAEAMQQSTDKFVKALSGADAALESNAGPAKSADPAVATPATTTVTTTGSPPANVLPPPGTVPDSSGQPGGMVGMAGVPQSSTQVVGSGPLPRETKSKSAGLRTGNGPRKPAEMAARPTSQTASARQVRKIPGFVELN